MNELDLLSLSTPDKHFMSTHKIHYRPSTKLNESNDRGKGTQQLISAIVK